MKIYNKLKERLFGKPEPLQKSMAKDHIFREARKLLDILNTWGNCLVPSIVEGKETYAKERLEWIIEKAKNEYGMTVEDIDAGISKL